MKTINPKPWKGDTPMRTNSVLVIEPAASWQRLQESKEYFFEDGRISVFGRVESTVVRKEQVPTAIAPESFQTQERFVTGLAPILAWPLEAGLVLPTG